MEFEEFIKRIKILNPNGFTNINLSLYQHDMLKFINENRLSIIHKRRQEGVSTAISIYLSWLLIINPNYHIGAMFASNSEKEKNIKIIFDFLKTIFPTINRTSNQIKLPNGASIFFKLHNNETVFRGVRVDLIYLSELSINYMDLFPSLRPCLNNNGRFIITTTNLMQEKENSYMNREIISEYWMSFFSGKRIVLFEKKRKL